MNTSIKSIVKNLSFSLVSNLISLFISTIIVIIVPKMIGVSEYGYFQLYLFYSSYIGFFHLGWCDGIYLNYGGKYYDELNKKKMAGQFWSLLVFEFMLTSLLFLFIYLYSDEANKTLILYLTVLSILFVIPKTMLSYILQLSNRIKEYAYVTIIEKVVYCLAVLIILFFIKANYTLLIYADLLGKVFSLILSIYFCKDIIVSKTESFLETLAEIFKNINSGSKLMIANIAGMLIIGIIRLAIENNWSIEVFGKVSLAISVSNLMMVFVNAVGIVLFPMLKRSNSERLNSIYGNLRDTLMIILFALMILYYPAQYIFVEWLPEYSISFKYMALMFPICIYECKMSMLINTYMKALRKENALLCINLLTLILSGILTVVSVYWLNNLELSVLIIFLLFAFRCIACEMFLSKYIDIDLNKNIFYELILSLFFIFITWFFPTNVACISFTVMYIIYLYLKRRDIYFLFKKIRKIV